MEIIFLIIVLAGTGYFLLFTEPGKNLISQLNEAYKKNQANNQAQREAWQQKANHLYQSKDPNTARTLLAEIQELSHPAQLSILLGKDEAQRLIKTIASICADDSMVLNYFANEIKKNRFSAILSFPKGEAYNMALQILEENPDQPKVKQFALEIGRWYFGKQRGHGPTIYDEQAIQNDINVRAK